MRPLQLIFKERNYTGYDYKFAWGGATDASYEYSFYSNGTIQEEAPEEASNQCFHLVGWQPKEDDSKTRDEINAPNNMNHDEETDTQNETKGKMVQVLESCFV